MNADFDCQKNVGSGKHGNNGAKDAMAIIMDHTESSHSLETRVGDRLLVVEGSNLLCTYDLRRFRKRNETCTAAAGR